MKFFASSTTGSSRAARSQLQTVAQVASTPPGTAAFELVDRRVYHILRQEGSVVNAKGRHYTKLGLQPRNKAPKRRVKANLREDRAPAVRPNDVWAMDFVHDQLAMGRKLRIRTVVNTFSQLPQVVDPSSS